MANILLHSATIAKICYNSTENTNRKESEAMSTDAQLQSGRTAYWDNLKYFLMTLVVLGHFADVGGFSGTFWPRYIFSTIYTFHMPLFLFVSGLFSKSAIDGKRFRVERVLSFLILYASYKIIRTLVGNAVFGLHRSFNFFIASDLAWFMLTMASLLVMTYAFRRVRPVCLLLIAILCGFVIGYDDNVGDIFSLTRTVVYWPFFLLGYYLDPEKLQNAMNSKIVRAVGIAVFALFLIMVYWQWGFYNGITPMFSAHNGARSIHEGFAGYHAWFRLPYYLWVCVVSFAFMSLIPHRRLFFITNAGGRTLAVFFFHNMLLRESGFVTWLQTSLPGEKAYVAAIIVCAIVWTAFLSLKPFNIPFKWIMNAKYEWLLQQEETASKEL